MLEKGGKEKKLNHEALMGGKIIVGHGQEGPDEGVGICSWLLYCFCFFLILVRLVQEEAQYDASALVGSTEFFKL